MSAPRGLTPEQVRRIASRLDAAVVPVRRRSLLPVLAVLALLLSAGTALAWATGSLPRLPPLRALFTSTPIARRPPSAVMPGAPARPTEIAAPPAGPPAPDLEEPAAREAPRPKDLRPLVPTSHRQAPPSPAAAAAHEEPAAPEPPANSVTPDNPIAREGESFANVLRRWRRDHDGRAALSALDLHDHRFSQGQMGLESRLLRVEILLSQGRDGDALALLDRLALDRRSVPRSRELLTVRAELRIKAGRCAEARADLASVGAGTDALAERARNALSHCP